jgi:hypothetical protein
MILYAHLAVRADIEWKNDEQSMPSMSIWLLLRSPFTMSFQMK